MGTRHLICIIYEEKLRLAQYGQRDGYPDGQGIDIVEFLIDADLEKFKDHVSRCKMTTRNDGDLSSKVLKYIMESEDRVIQVSESEIEFGADSLMCEWAYIIDLDREVLEVYRGFNQKQDALGYFTRFEPPKSISGLESRYNVVDLALSTPISWLKDIRGIWAHIAYYYSFKEVNGIEEYQDWLDENALEHTAMLIKLENLGIYYDSASRELKLNEIHCTK